MLSWFSLALVLDLQQTLAATGLVVKVALVLVGTLDVGGINSFRECFGCVTFCTFVRRYYLQRATKVS